MRKLATLFVSVLFLAPFAASADSFTGQLVDTRCMAMSPKNTGQDHKGGALKGCATACAKMGIPVALYVDGKMHTIAAPAPLLAPHMAKEATIEGKMTPGGVIMPMKVMVEGKEVDLKAMM